VREAGAGGVLVLRADSDYGHDAVAAAAVFELLAGSC